MTPTKQKKPNNPVVLGLTGPTGSGKTVVAETLKALGAAVIDADAVARKVVGKGEPCLAALTKEFGSGILNADGTLNRHVLAHLAFASDEKTALLTAVTHPFILSEMRKELHDAAESGVPLIVVDAPLLFESAFDTVCDKTVAVLSPRSTRLARICERDGISKSDATARIDRQPEDDFYCSRADRIIQNTGDLAALQAASKEIFQWLIP